MANQINLSKTKSESLEFVTKLIDRYNELQIPGKSSKLGPKSAAFVAIKEFQNSLNNQKIQKKLKKRSICPIHTFLQDLKKEQNPPSQTTAVRYIERVQDLYKQISLQFVYDVALLPRVLAGIVSDYLV